MLKLGRKILAVLTPHERRRLYVLTVVDTVSSIADIAGLAVLLWVIRLYTEGPAGEPLWPVLLLFLLFAVKNWLSFLIYSAQARLRYRVASRISRQNLLYYLEGDYRQY